MKEVFIKYNPYTLETELTVNGKTPAKNSKLKEKVILDFHLQEWIEELPDLLIDEYNDNKYHIVFHGTRLDYEDLVEVFTQARDQGKLTAELERIPAKETGDKEQLISEVFEEIKNGPFEELRDPQIISAFEHERSSDFQVCVVATMSAGKSTLINALLGTKLMPSKQEACTAIITRIKDTDGQKWEAKVYDKNNELSETYTNITLETMDRLNSDENVSCISISGNIPFVTAEDVSLVLIDTPGPNNSRNPEHRRIQNEFLGKSSNALVLYIMEGTFGNDDDDILLRNVANSMSVGGKQSKDRFLFVVNKMDNRRKEDGDTEQTLRRVRMYLERHGISNPNLFPMAALPALDIRRIENGEKVDEDTREEAELKVRKMNRSNNMHLEAFATLPSSLKASISKQLDEASKANDINTQALIHTGIVSLEAAIRQYVQKYAKTLKIKNIVDTFIHKLDEVGCFEKTKRELAGNQDKAEKIIGQISAIKNKIDDVKVAQQFRKSVDSVVDDVEENLKVDADKIVKKFNDELVKLINLYKKDKRKLDIDQAMDEISRLNHLANELEPQFRTEMEYTIQEKLIATCSSLLRKYKEKLESFAKETEAGKISEIQIEPLKLMEATTISNTATIVEKYIRSERVENGSEWIPNTDRKWYKPWTWFQEKGYWKTKYKNVKFVKADEMVQEFFMPIQDSIWDSAQKVESYTMKQAKQIAETFDDEFRKLDLTLKDKLNELENYAIDQEKAEERIQECERRLAWLEMIKDKINSILEI